MSDRTREPVSLDLEEIRQRATWWPGRAPEARAQQWANDVLALIAEVERLRAHLTEGVLERSDRQYDQMMKAHERAENAEAEVTRLRAAARELLDVLYGDLSGGNWAEGRGSSRARASSRGRSLMSMYPNDPKPGPGVGKARYEQEQRYYYGDLWRPFADPPANCAVLHGPEGCPGYPHPVEHAELHSLPEEVFCEVCGYRDGVHNERWHALERRIAALEAKGDA